MHEYADSFPHMGGVAIGPWLRSYAAMVPPEQAIVETGSWLGGGTAQLASTARCPIHVYDQFCARSAEVEKAKAFDVELTERKDTLSLVKKSLESFDADISYHRGSIVCAKYHGPPIGLFVNDAGKKLLPKILKIFQPHFAPRAIVVLMDYHFREGQHFDGEQIEDRIGGTTTAVFRCWQ